MPATYEPIATTTLGSTNDTVTFSSIASTYTDLFLVVSARDSSTSFNNAQMGLRFNSDSGSNYSNTNVGGTGSSASSSRGTSQTFMIMGRVTNQTSGYSANDFGIVNISIMNYANSTTNKTAVSRSNYIFGTDTQVEARVGLWRNTAAITSVSVYTNSGFGFVSGSTFTLYGIKAA
jgi:hypothetical protein